MPKRLSQREVAARRRRVVILRSQGETFAEIAERTGHKTASAAVQDYSRAMKAAHAELAAGGHDAPLLLELERLDAVERVLQRTLAAVSDPDMPRYDASLTLRTVDRITRLSARRSAVLGLDRSRPRDDADGAGAGDDDVDEVAAQRARRIAHR